MGGSADVRSIEALDSMRAALKRFASDVQEALACAERAIQATVDWITERVHHWQYQVEQWTEEVRRAEARLSACLASTDEDGNGPDCSAEEAALAEAARRLRAAQEELETAQRWMRQIWTAAEEFRKESMRMNGATDEAVSGGSSFLDGKASDLHSYISKTGGGLGAAIAAAAAGLGGAIGAGAGSIAEREDTRRGGRGSASGSGPTIVPPPTDSAASGRGFGRFAPGPVQTVSLSQINVSSSHVKSAADFQKVPYATVVDGLHKLHDVVIPAVGRGASGDYFRSLDGQMGLRGESSYFAVYDAYYSEGQAIKLEQTAGGYEIVNGYHRIMAAIWEGYSDLPAFIRGSGG